MTREIWGHGGNAPYITDNVSAQFHAPTLFTCAYASILSFLMKATLPQRYSVSK